MNSDKFPIDIPVLSTELPGIESKQFRTTRAVVGFMPSYVVTRCVNLSWEKRGEQGAKYRSYLSKTRVSAMTKIIESAQIPITPPISLSCDPENDVSLEKEGHIRVLSSSVFFVVGGHDQVAAMMNNKSNNEMTIPFVCLIEPLKELERSLFIMSMRQPSRVADDLWRVPQSTPSEPERGLYQNNLSCSSENVTEAHHSLSLARRSTKDEIDSYTDVVIYLNRQSDPWKGRIKMLGEPHNAEHVITHATMERSLMPFSSSRKGWRPSAFKELAEVLNEYWLGLASIGDFGEVFSDPRNHILQKGLGVSVMHALLVDLYPWRSMAGMSDKPESEEFARLLALPMGELSEENALGEVISGRDFWRKGHQGGATVFDSTAGRRHLVKKILRLITSKVSLNEKEW